METTLHHFFHFHSCPVPPSGPQNLRVSEEWYNSQIMWWKYRRASRLIAPSLERVFYGGRRGLWLPLENGAQRPGQPFSPVSSGFPQPFRGCVLNKHLLDVRITQFAHETNRQFLYYISPKLKGLGLWANLSPRRYSRLQSVLGGAGLAELCSSACQPLSSQRSWHSRLPPPTSPDLTQWVPTSPWTSTAKTQDLCRFRMADSDCGDMPRVSLKHSMDLVSTGWLLLTPSRQPGT